MTETQRMDSLPIDAMLQFDTNADADANEHASIDPSVNEALRMLTPNVPSI